MATPPSTSSKSTKKTSAKSSAVRAEWSAACAPSSRPRRRAKARESTSTSSSSASDSVGASHQSEVSSSIEIGASQAPQFLVVAQVLGAHGIRGEVKCRIVTDFPSRRFKRGSTVHIHSTPHQVQAARIQGDQVLLKLEDVADRDAAIAFIGADVEVPA